MRAILKRSSLHWSWTGVVTRLRDGVIRRGATWSYVIRVVDPHSGLSRPRWVGGFATEGAAKSARDRGLEFLQIPANYYEDLDARFDLDPGFLATLKDLNLLYDRDADGEFLHFYTATVGSVFFEMVERRGTYDGYGAPNAPVRHAVQYDSLHRN